MLSADQSQPLHRLPPVSIVMPCYNAAPWLEESIGSCLAQVYPPHEILVVNDGSTDGSGLLARSLLRHSAVPWKVIDVANGGPSRARNIGWRVARGEWIQFLDADDRLCDEKLAVQAAAADCSQDVAVLYSEWRRLVRGGDGWNPEPGLRLPVLEDPVEELLQSDGFVPLGSEIFRRAWLARVGGFDEGQRMIEDVNLKLRIAMEGGRFRHIASEQALFFYRVGHDASLVRRGAVEFWDGCVRNGRLAESRWRSTSRLTLARRQLLVSIYVAAARQFFDTDRCRFEELVAVCETLLPGFIPPGPWHLRLLSRVIGYTKAESVAATYRRMKRELART